MAKQTLQGNQVSVGDHTLHTAIGLHHLVHVKSAISPTSHPAPALNSTFQQTMYSDGHTSFHTMLQMVTKHGCKPIPVKIDSGAEINTVPLRKYKKTVSSTCDKIRKSKKQGITSNYQHIGCTRYDPTKVPRILHPRYTTQVSTRHPTG